MLEPLGYLAIDPVKHLFGERKLATEGLSDEPVTDSFGDRLAVPRFLRTTGPNPSRD